MTQDKIKVVAITTRDNPYDPLDEFDQWYVYDTQHGYNTCSILDRLSKTSESQSQVEFTSDIEETIDRMIDLFPIFYKKIVSYT